MTSDATVVFVYGTLRPGQPNHGILARDIDYSISAHGHGLLLYAAAHHSYPYATVGHPEDLAAGDLLTLRPDRAFAGVRRLDYLEGFDPDHPDRGHYLRRRRTFVTDQPGRFGPAGTTTDAWIYLAGPRTSLRFLPPIPTGDWLHPAPVPEGPAHVWPLRCSPALRQHRRPAGRAHRARALS